MTDGPTFDLEPLVARLAVAADPERAISISRMMLDHAFGEKYGMSSCDYPERVFPIGDWNEVQKIVLRAIARCGIAWPAIGFSLQMALEIDFEPTQEELRDALSGESVKDDSESESGAATDFSDEAVLAAVVKLYESFAISNRGTTEALKEFAPYRPYSAVGVAFLIAKLSAKTTAERESAAWALGRMGPYAVEAVPSLLLKMDSDAENRYSALALEEIPLSPENYELLCDRVENGSEQTDMFQYMRIIGDNVTTERLNRWISHPNAQLRYQAIGRLGERLPTQIKTTLLRALADPDKNVVRRAKSVLAQPTSQTACWYFAELNQLTDLQRREIGDAFCNEKTDVSSYKSQLFEVLRSHEDVALVKNLVPLVAYFGDKRADDVDVLVEIRGRFDSVSLKSELIRTIRGIHSSGYDEKLIDSLAEFLDEPNEYIRALAIDNIGCFKVDTEQPVALLKGAMRDSSERVQLKALWHLYYRGPAYIRDLVAGLENYSDRVSAELIWALGTSGNERELVVSALTSGIVANRPLTGNAVRWLAAQTQ